MEKNNRTIARARSNVRNTAKMAKGKHTQTPKAKTVPFENENLLPRIVFDRYWTERDEQKLSLAFAASSHRELSRRISAPEEVLWKRAFSLFNMNPYELLPAGVKVDTSRNDRLFVANIADADEDGGFVNTNWAVDVCRLFSDILCCTAFKGKLDYLRYILRYVLFLRVGLAKPSDDSIQQRGKDLVKSIKELVGPGVDEEKLTKLVEDSVGEDKIPHPLFLAKLRLKVKLEEDGIPGLIKQDFTAIKAAWDAYVDDPDSSISLKKIADYAQLWKERHGKISATPTGREKYRSEDIKRLKEEYFKSRLRDEYKAEKRASLEDDDDLTLLNRVP